VKNDDDFLQNSRIVHAITICFGVVLRFILD